MSDVPEVEEETLLAVFIPNDLAEWLETWAYHIGLTVDGAVQVALAGQKSRSQSALMVALPKQRPDTKSSYAKSVP